MARSYRMLQDVSVGMTRSTPTSGVHSQGPGYYWLLTSIKLRFKWQEVTGC